MSGKGGSMRGSGIRKGLVVLAAVVAGACCGARAHKFHPDASSECDREKDHEIEVTRSGVSCENVRILKNKNSVVWRTALEGRLHVAFDDNPFSDLECENQECHAYWVHKKLDKETSFKYSVYVNGEKIVDPNVIIKP
jgi:hypothetical protein